jgi:hypothetical protein
LALSQQNLSADIGTPIGPCNTDSGKKPAGLARLHRSGKIFRRCFAGSIAEL